MYSKHYFVFFDKTNDFTIDEFGNIGRTMEDGPFNSNEIGRHVDTETIFMVRANAEKLVNAWEGLDVYYIGDNVIHMHGQAITNSCKFITNNQVNPKGTPATHNETKRHLWNVWNSVQYLSYDQFNAGTRVTQKGATWCGGNRREFTSGWCCAGRCNRGDCCDCISSCSSCRVVCYNRNNVQLCIHNDYVGTRCHNIWQEDNSDARWWIYDEYVKEASKQTTDYNNRYGFSDGNIDDLHYPR